MSIQQVLDAETRQFLHSNKSDKGPTSSSKATKNIRIDLIHLDGNIMFPRQCIRLHLRHLGGNRASAGGQRGTGQLHHFFVPDETLRLLEILSSVNRRRGVKSTPIAHTFFSCALCQRACPSLLSQLFFRLQSPCHTLTSRTRVAQAQHEALRIVSCPKLSHLIAQCHTLHLS